MKASIGNKQNPNLYIPYPPIFKSNAANIIDPLVGASTWAIINHWCIGTIGTLKKKPINSDKNNIFLVPEFVISNNNHLRLSNSVEPKISIKYTIGIHKKIEPTNVYITKYFTAKFLLTLDPWVIMWNVNGNNIISKKIKKINKFFVKKHTEIIVSVEINVIEYFIGNFSKYDSNLNASLLEIPQNKTKAIKTTNHSSQLLNPSINTKLLINISNLNILENIIKKGIINNRMLFSIFKKFIFKLLLSLFEYILKVKIKIIVLSTKFTIGLTAIIPKIVEIIFPGRINIKIAKILKFTGVIGINFHKLINILTNMVNFKLYCICII